MHLNHTRFSLLKKTVSIASVLVDKQLIDRFSIHTDRLVGPCPIHRGNNPNAFCVNLKKNLWYCFTKCQCGGDLIDFVRKLENKNHFEAAKYLCSLKDVSDQSTTPLIKNTPQKSSFRPYAFSLSLDPTTPFLKKKEYAQKLQNTLKQDIIVATDF